MRSEMKSEMKRWKHILVIAAISFSAAACGQKSGEQTETVTSAVEEATTEAEAVTTAGEPVREEVSSAAAPESEEASSAAEPEETGFEDNFAVDDASAKDFAQQLKLIVMSEDLEGLADLTGYPVYVGFSDEGVSVESKEEFMELGSETVFTKELKDSVAAADDSALSPSMAGFVLAGESGRPNIIFGVVDGKLMVKGINY